MPNLKTKKAWEKLQTFSYNDYKAIESGKVR